MKTDKKILKQAKEIAMLFYEELGYRVVENEEQELALWELVNKIRKSVEAIQRKEIFKVIDKWWDNLDIKTGKEIEELKKQIGEE